MSTGDFDFVGSGRSRTGVFYEALAFKDYVVCEMECAASWRGFHPMARQPKGHADTHRTIQEI